MVDEKLISKNNQIVMNKLVTIPNMIIKVEPLRPKTLPHNRIIIAVIKGRKTIDKYTKLNYMVIIS